MVRKVAVSSSWPGGLDSTVDPRFGRCRVFMIVIVTEDKEISSVKTVENPAYGYQSGTGVAVAQLIVDEGVEVVITSNVGPRAYFALRTAGVRIYEAPSGIKVRDAIRLFLEGTLRELTTPGTAGIGRGGCSESSCDGETRGRALSR